MSLKTSDPQKEVDQFFGDKRIEQHLQNIAKNASLSKPNFRVSRAVKAGNNFVGDVYRTVIEGEKDGKIERFYAILKCAPTDPRRRLFMKIRKVFLREIYFYETILSVFDDVLRDYDMSVEYFPMLYGASKEDENEVLVLEDLKSKGYLMRDTKFLDYQHARLALRKLGRFHAYSFATRAKKPETFEMFKSLEEPLFVVQNPPNNEMHDRLVILCNVIRKALADEEDHYQKRFDHFANNMMDIMAETVKGSNAEPYAVVNHGDAWTNNILFKYKENEGSSEPQDLRFLDFQLCRYASPAADISYTLFCSSTYKMRLEHYDELLREYYDSLSTCLRKLDCDPDVLFPYEVLLDHMERFGKYAAGMAVFVIHIFTDQNNEVVEISTNINAESYHERLQKDDFYRNMLKETYKEFVDRNIL
ncbi:hypothetical protein KPH14_001098 [Odynerus spinipes]|uniref:CHK kinase-like domain-containing protein n=1 Tax=Odynerus spinipes TaxID=1348599 RepID=A0AAD9RDN9_9HYME|nr:hypothetical protein KPH14_001098 [Odynerus spinipes]